MNAGEILAMFRNDVMDTQMPYLWTDEEAYVYLNDAYTMFVRFIEGTPDFTSAVCCEIPYASGDTEVDVHPSVVRIMRAFNNAGTEISVIENTDVPLVRGSDGKVRLLRVGAETGANVQYLVLGANQYAAQLHPVPTASGTLKLQVRRLPLAELTTASDSLTDVPEKHHIHLIKWMKALAYRKQDAETFDLAKAEESEQSFLQYVNQSVFELNRYRRKTKRSLRSDQDQKNPMLQAAASRLYNTSTMPQPSNASRSNGQPE